MKNRTGHCIGSTLLILTCIFTISLKASVSLYQTFQEANSSIDVLASYTNSQRIGDFNSDGINDIMLSVINDTCAKGYIYYGSSWFDTNPDLIWDFKPNGWPSGKYYYDFISLKSMGDINNDGFSDINTYVHFGYSGTESYSSIYLGNSYNEPEIYKGYYGDGLEFADIHPIGDFNNDGADDYLVCHWTSNSRWYPDYEKLELFYADQNILIPFEKYVQFVGGKDDLNGDGFDDIVYLIGDQYCIYLGSTSPDLSIDMVIPAPPSIEPGYSNAYIEDINNDKYDDLILTNNDSMYVYWGGSTMATIPDYKQKKANCIGDINNDNLIDFANKINNELHINLGYQNIDKPADIIIQNPFTDYNIISFKSTGDVNGDNIDDLLFDYSNGQSKKQSVLYYGGSPFDTTADVIFDYQGRDNGFGWSVSNAGDMNNDGFQDIIAGAFGYNQSTGRAYIYLGNNPVDFSSDLILTGENPNDYFGVDVQSLGDINQDGYDDFIVSAEGYNNHTGRAYVYFGGYVLANTPGLILTGENEGDYFGKSVASAGDVNNDGYPDILIGACKYNNSTGRTYIYYGGASPDTIADVILDGDTQGNEFGADVSGTGDINNDGFDDVIIGAPYFSSYRGKACLYFGSQSMNQSPDMEFEGKNTGDLFGSALTNAGDMNKDGYDDFAVGAYKYREDNGRVYIYHGASSPDTSADFVLDGHTAYENFGRALAGAGDVNQDGYDDLLVGGYVYDTFRGHASLFLGGNPMDNIADEVMYGEEQYSYFGSAVAGAGDVNDDGTMDLIVGAYEYGTKDNGKVYLYQYEPEPVTVTYSFPYSGWAMVSLPLFVDDASVSALFPTAQGGIAYAWNGQNYDEVDTLETSEGYWINIETPDTVNVTGRPFYHYIKHFETQGWYMIGSVLDSTHISDADDDPDGQVLAPCFGWNTQTASYETKTILHQTQSCWAAVQGPCDLDVDFYTGGLTKTMNDPQNTGSPPPPPFQTTALSKQNEHPNQFMLYPVYPNPFNPETNIRFNLTQKEEVHIFIYNIKGEQVDVMFLGEMDQGYHSITWNAGSQPSGTYIIRIQTPTDHRTQKCLLIK